MQSKGATKAYRKSQSLIFKTEAPQSVGAGEGTDSQDFMADLSASEVTDPDTMDLKRVLSNMKGLLWM